MNHIILKEVEEKGAGYLHEVLLQQTVHPGFSNLHWPNLVGDVAALYENHL